MMKCTKCGSPSGRRKFKRLTVRGKRMTSGEVEALSGMIRSESKRSYASRLYQIIDSGDFPAQPSTVSIVIVVIAAIFIFAYAAFFVAIGLLA